MGASICCAEAEADTQFTILAWCSLKKQYPIFLSDRFKLSNYIKKFSKDVLFSGLNRTFLGQKHARKDFG
jgi:hypothetical protein